MTMFTSDRIGNRNYGIGGARIFHHFSAELSAVFAPLYWRHISSRESVEKKVQVLLSEGVGGRRRNLLKSLLVLWGKTPCSLNP